MGNGQSNVKLYFKIERVMPGTDSPDDGSLSNLFDKKGKYFASSKDRDQFIYSAITVISQNGAIDLRDHDFRLLYSRRENDRVVARLVAEKEGIIKSQIVAESDGKDQAEAFWLFKKHVELHLDRILSNVPGSSHQFIDRADGALTPATTMSRAGSTVQSTPASPSAAQQSVSEAPPAYGKAVKDWRSDEKKR